MAGLRRRAAAGAAGARLAQPDLIDPGFGPRLVDCVGDAPHGSFSLDLGIEIDGVRHPLLPILVRLRERDGLAGARVVDGDLRGAELPVVAARLRQAEARAAAVHRCHTEIRYGAKSWKCERRVAAPIEATPWVWTSAMS